MTTCLYICMALVVSFLLVKRCISYFTGSTRRAPHPPGPKPRPLVGNMFELPLVDLGIKYLEWGKKYNSDLLYASAFGNGVLVINSQEDADELFDRRAALYSDRPVLPICKVMGWDYNIALLPYGDAWRYHRKICQQNFRHDAVKNYHPVILSKVSQMLEGLLKTPEDFAKHSKMLSVSIPMSTMYGYDIDSIEDPIIAIADESNAVGAGLLIPGSTIINIFPTLGNLPAWLPGFSSRKRAARVLQLTEDIKRIPMEFVESRMNEGTHVPSLVSDFLEKKKTSATISKKEEEAIINIAYTIYGAASDTTISATGTFFYLMATHPEIQKKAQADIDRIIGPNRLPNFEDRESLPYIEAIYREVLRWRPPLQVGAPHALSDDDHYKGYFIPKGTTVFGNIWAMTHNPAVYSDPYTFQPERFFDIHGKLNDDTRVLAYGFGRRVCVGKYIASATLWLTIVSVLASFDIRKPRDKQGNEIEISDEYDDRGVISHKKPFECLITPRRGFNTTSQLIADAIEIVGC